MVLPPLTNMHVPVLARLGPEHLAVRRWASVHLPACARLGLYARKTWLYTPLCVSTYPFVPVLACTLGKIGCTPLDMCARARSYPFGPVFPGHRAVHPWTCVHVPVRGHLGLYASETWLYAPIRVCTFQFGPFWVCTPPKPGFTLLTVMHVPVRPRFGLYSRETWLYAPGRICTCPFVPVWVCTPGTPSCTPLHECARACLCWLGSVSPENLA